MSPKYTVIGVWVNDTPVSVGVVAGQHGVEGGSNLEEIDGQQGAWAQIVEAADVDDAEAVALSEIMAEEDEDPVYALAITARAPAWGERFVTSDGITLEWTDDMAGGSGYAQVEPTQRTAEEIAEEIIAANYSTDDDAEADADPLQDALVDRVVDADGIRSMLHAAVREARA